MNLKFLVFLFFFIPISCLGQKKVNDFYDLMTVKVPKGSSYTISMHLGFDEVINIENQKDYKPSKSLSQIYKAISPEVTRKIENNFSNDTIYLLQQFWMPAPNNPSNLLIIRDRYYYFSVDTGVILREFDGVNWEEPEIIETIINWDLDKLEWFVKEYGGHIEDGTLNRATRFVVRDGKLVSRDVVNFDDLSRLHIARMRHL